MKKRPIFRDLRLQSNRFFIPVAGLILILYSSTPGRAEPPYNQTPRDEKYLREDLTRLAADPDNPVLLREAGISYFQVGSPENDEYLKSAAELLEKAYKINPDDSFTVMFLGCTYGQEAGNASIFSRKKMAARAFEFIDRAIALEPGSYRLRLMRGLSGLKADGRCGRDKPLKEDIDFIRSFLKAEPPEDVPVHLTGSGLMLLGNYYDSLGDEETARKYWNMAIKIGPGTELEKAAQEKLGEI